MLTVGSPVVAAADVVAGGGGGGGGGMLDVRFVVIQTQKSSDFDQHFRTRAGKSRPEAQFVSSVENDHCCPTFFVKIRSWIHT